MGRSRNHDINKHIEDGKRHNSALGGSVGGYIKSDGTVPLTADWDVGAFTLTCKQLISDIAIGTQPLDVTSTTVCTNLNADMVDGVHGPFLEADGTTALSGDWDTGATGYDILMDSSIRARNTDAFVALNSYARANTISVDTINININSTDETSDIEIDNYAGGLLFDASQAKVIADGVFQFRDDIYLDYDVYIGDDLDVDGTLTKGSGTFKIDHPILPDTLLYHGFVESPEFGLIYSGIAKLINGKVIVDIDLACRMYAGTFDALCQRPRVLLQNNDTFDRVKASMVNQGMFTIECENPVDIEIVWFVYAERKDKFIMESGFTDDQGHLITEVSKETPLRTGKPIKN